MGPLLDAAPARGLLSPGDPDRSRVRPPTSLADYVHHCWLRWWSAQVPRVAEALPYPCVTIRFERINGVESAELGGPRTTRVTRRLSGDGEVFGITFRPGAFAPLFGGDVAALTDRTVPLATVFGPAGEAWADATGRAADLEAKVAVAVAFLAPRLAPLPSQVRRLRDLVEAMASDRALVRVEDVCRVAGVDRRALQRGFRRIVGVTPKGALQRFRLIEAVERLRGPRPPHLAELAHSLGYADQAHLARDFKRAIGETPLRFARKR